MHNRERIIEGLEETEIKLTQALDRGGTMSLIGTFRCLNNVTDALSLLKEQEAVEPRRIDGKRNHFIKCGNCNYDLMTGFQFCPHCGRAVKWE